MRHLLHTIALSGLLLLPNRLASQTYGEWDRPCDSRYGPRFSAPFVHGVKFDGKEFLTDWRSESSERPLPSRNWYEAAPDPDPVSTDNVKRWYNAGVKVHCWVQRTPYWVSHMADPIEYRGSLSDNCNKGVGGNWELQPAPDGSGGSYDPYDPAYDEECEGTTDGGDPPSGGGTQYNPGDTTGGETVGWSDGVGTGSPSVCGDEALVEYVCIDYWDERTGGWVEWDCGYVTTC
jgi:hypothetical protein